MRTLGLREGTEIPVLGFGTWQLEGDSVRRSVATALEVSYRHIDTALIYDNQRQIAQAIAESGIERSELFITSKIWRDRLDREGVVEQTEQILEELAVDYVDLLLVHWPNPKFDIKETMEAMEEMKQAGKTRNIGVSNFNIRNLQAALDTGAAVAINQVEYHPSLNQKSLLEFCRENDIIVTAYSPLAQGQDLNIDTIQELAAKYDKPASQVILNWLLQKDIVAIPRSDNPDHIADNYQATTWELEPKDTERIDGLGLWQRILTPGFADFDE